MTLLRLRWVEFMSTFPKEPNLCFNTLHSKWIGHKCDDDHAQYQ